MNTMSRESKAKIFETNWFKIFSQFSLTQHRSENPMDTILLKE